ncbi:MAG: YybH family protein [bacterium]
MRFSNSVLWFVLILCIALFSCVRPESEELDLVQLRKAIEETNAKFVEAFNQGDAAAVVALYTEDASILPPNNEMIQGREGVQQFWNGAMQMGIKNVALTTVDLNGSGNLVYEIGRYSLTIQPEGQEVMKDSGKYIVVWKHQEDGTWKLHTDIWNTSMPIPGQ